MGGDKVDFCWLVFEHEYDGAPQFGWLKRDGNFACRRRRGER
jgi:hypothetical protein